VTVELVPRKKKRTFVVPRQRVTHVHHKGCECKGSLKTVGHGAGKLDRELNARKN